MSAHAVVIAGGGPTGLMLAGELALAGADVVIVERRANQNVAGARAGGLHARTIEILDQRGIAERFLAEGQAVQRCGFARVQLDLSDFPSRHPYSLGLWQNRIERLLADWVELLGVRICRSLSVTDFAQDDAGVTVMTSDGALLRADYLVGCDGGHSTVRKCAGIAFAGSDATTSSLIAEVDVREPPPLGVHHTAQGVYSFGKRDYEIRGGEVLFKDGGPIRVMVPEARVGSGGEPTLEDLRAALIAACGTDYGVHSPTWLSRFTDAARQAAAYRDRRVLLAGDAAHVHSPVGGQGLNTGVQDAVNLGWKLAQVVNGISPESLLDTYHAERHPVGARVLRHALAGATLLRPDDGTAALRDTLAELLVMDEPRKQLAAELSGLGIRYDLGDGHPLIGRRMPDLDLATDAGPQRVYSLLHEGQAVLLELGAASLGQGPWPVRVRCLRARYDGPWVLPAFGAVAAPKSVLIRPDGYVAWVGDGDVRGLFTAMDKWCGAAQG
ncbi:MAG: FAD-dependent monooxygenase [Burkholderiales bacterium]|jgi:2-polyprenyl-6-methoxyphenol hydroxylase-like FAD-dependent oxidoreductase|nr:FAD-dependent monooxygenase [Burkholderiales bacterium]